MTKAFIAETIQQSAEITAVAAHKVAGTLVDAIVAEMKKSGKFTLPGFLADHFGRIAGPRNRQREGDPGE
ncbi:MAG: hypothetical protein B7Z58_18340 [Acidiphilium sp. 37-64-53]|uniref:HU family DNA-binding protein n=1 Tax=Acidiphilium sp. 37-64-53 TaxID=1970299 RepID=UPI000BCA8AD7|nr:HU family DNA-binding protein [Acidiphilium sp. 37-64-53]OYV99606.1 MAG: hypothetical protein B7Z58_18340 [Acidiphilium sp. 37-64-53]